MKRLKSILLKMEPNTTTYKELYEGEMLVVPNKGQPFDDYDNCYYFGDIGYKSSRQINSPKINLQLL